MLALVFLRRFESLKVLQAALRTPTIDRYQQYLDRYWHAEEMTMINHLTGKGTVLTWTDYRFRAGLDEHDFTTTGLKRVR